MEDSGKVQVRLSKLEQEQLNELLGGGLQPVRTVLRALVLRQLADGQTIRKVARNVGLTPKTVWLTSQRYQQGGLDRAVYEKPLSGREPVVCVDEKPVVLHQEVRPPIAMQPGRVARRDAEYRRCGTADVFCGVQPKVGRHFTKVTDNRSSPEFADYLLDIAAAYPEADTIHLVMDNLSSHTRKAIVERFGAEAGDRLWNRFTVHNTPKHGSWLNQAEIAIGLFSRQCLGQRRIADRTSLRQETQAWNRRVNRDRVMIQWNFTRKKARQKFGYTITRSRY
jgi:hypothetical protein